MRSVALKQPANPGASADAVFYDSALSKPNAANAHAGKTGREMQRVGVVIFADQAVTVKHDWYAPGSSNARTVNGDGNGDLTTLSVLYQRDFRLLPGRNRIYCTTGTAPTVWEVYAEMTDDQAMAQGL